MSDLERWKRSRKRSIEDKVFELVEGGDKITKNMLRKRLINLFYLFKSSKNLSKSKKHLFFTSYDILNKHYRTKSKITSNLAKDKITIYIR